MRWTSFEYFVGVARLLTLSPRHLDERRQYLTRFPLQDILRLRCERRRFGVDLHDDRAAGLRGKRQ